jgi:hypothetical protein
VRTIELTRSHRRRLTRYAHVLARSGRYENAVAIIEELRSHKDFDPASHENSTFRAALGAICKFARSKYTPAGAQARPSPGARRSGFGAAVRNGPLPALDGRP